jgi:alginate O-acetyltransferase complex protein AlgI
MALGLGAMFGFAIPENFNYPYAAGSVTAFWRRWHISLSSWFRDYLYIPLGGNRKGGARTSVNLFIVFFATGLWHGASFNFIFWGMGHGALLFAERIFRGKFKAAAEKSRVISALGHGYTLASVLVLWVFFRHGLRDSFALLGRIFSGSPGKAGMSLLLRETLINFPFAAAFLAAVLFSVPWWRKISPSVLKALEPLRPFAVMLLLALSLCALAANSYNPFIYFRF